MKAQVNVVDVSVVLSASKVRPANLEQSGVRAFPSLGVGSGGVTAAIVVEPLHTALFVPSYLSSDLLLVNSGMASKFCQRYIEAVWSLAGSVGE